MTAGKGRTRSPKWRENKWVLKCMGIGEHKLHWLGLPLPLQNASHNELKCAFHLTTPILYGWIKYYAYSLQKVNRVGKKKGESVVFFQCFGMEVPKLTAKTYPNLQNRLPAFPQSQHIKQQELQWRLFLQTKNRLPLWIFPDLCSKEAVKTLKQNYFKNHLQCFEAVMFS